MENFINTESFIAEFNEDMNGYVVTFKSRNVGNTQFTVEQNRLHGGYGETYLERYTEYDDELSADENEMMDKFILDRNNSGEF